MTFQTNIINIYGDQGKEWLRTLPELVQDIAKKYNLSHLSPVSNLSYNYVLAGAQKKLPIILKLGLDIDGLKREAAALSAFSEFGAVNVIAAEHGLILIERAIPGESLKSYFPEKENEAIQIVCTIMQRLHQAPIPQNNNFPHIKDWLATLDKDWDIPKHYLHKAQQLRTALLQIPTPEVLLHGDLHHDNVLRSDDGWLIIDAKGVIGDAAYEIWAFLNNPKEISKAMVVNRLNLFAHLLNLDAKNITAWCFVQSVLSWTWDLEDNLKPSCPWITDILDELTK